MFTNTRKIVHQRSKVIKKFKLLITSTNKLFSRRKNSHQRESHSPTSSVASKVLKIIQHFSKACEKFHFLFTNANNFSINTKTFSPTRRNFPNTQNCSPIWANRFKSTYNVQKPAKILNSNSPTPNIIHQHEKLFSNEKNFCKNSNNCSPTW